MIVGFVFKVYQPLLGLAVHFYRHYDGAGIDFLGLFLIVQFAFRLQLSHGHQRKIHQADELILPFPKNLFPVRQILPVGLLDGLPVIAVRKAYIRKLCGKGRMAAVIGPVGIQHPDLRHGRISLFLIPKIILDVQKIPEGHCQVQGRVKFFQNRFLHIAEAIKDFYIRRLFKHGHQSLRLFFLRLAGIHRIDAEALNRRKLFLRYRSLNHIRGGSADHRLFVLPQKSYALYR